MNAQECIFCDGPATRRKPDQDRNLYEYDCPRCGQYATGFPGTLVWPNATAAERNAEIAFIHAENKAKRRPLI